MKKIIIIIFIFLLIPLKVCAETNEKEYMNEQEESKIEDLYDHVADIKSEYDILNNFNADDYVESFINSGEGTLSLDNIANKLLKYAFKELRTAIKLMLLIIVIAIICSLINNLQNAFSNESLSNIAYFSCYSLLIIVVARGFYVGVDLVRETITSMSDFMTALIPVLMMLLASVGGLAQVAAMDPIIIGAVNIGTGIYVNFIIPMILLGFVLQFVNNISEQYKIDKLTKFINQMALWTQGILMTFFIGTLTIRGVTTKTIDEVTVKVSKYAIDNFIPIVGKSLSDAISTVAGYSLLLKNALSGLGLFIVVVIVIFPIIKIFIMAQLFKFSAAVIEPISDKRIVSCINSVGDSFIILMSCLISVSVMFFIMIAIVASTGKAIM